MNILFAGSPKSSARILEFLFKKDDISVVGAITQPDKRSGRGKNLIESDVSLNANVLGIRTFKPENLNTNEIKDEISSLEIDFLVVVAYGKIIPEWLLKLPKISPINIHFSLLPKYSSVHTSSSLQLLFRHNSLIFILSNLSVAPLGRDRFTHQ